MIYYNRDVLSLSNKMTENTVSDQLLLAQVNQTHTHTHTLFNCHMLCSINSDHQCQVSISGTGFSFPRPDKRYLRNKSVCMYPKDFFPSYAPTKTKQNFQLASWRWTILNAYIAVVGLNRPKLPEAKISWLLYCQIMTGLSSGLSQRHSMGELRPLSLKWLWTF